MFTSSKQKLATHSVDLNNMKQEGKDQEMIKPNWKKRVGFTLTYCSFEVEYGVSEVASILIFDSWRSV